MLKDQPAQQLKDFEDVEKKDRHHIQTHFKAIPLLHDVYELQVCHVTGIKQSVGAWGRGVFLVVSRDFKTFWGKQLV